MMLQASRTPLLHILLKNQCVWTGSAVNCRTSSSDNSCSSSYSSQQSNTSDADAVAADREICTTNINPPEIPTGCCMSGCANCVYIQYAVEMADYCKDGGTAALKVIDSIEDETLKTFLKMEIERALLMEK